MQRALAAALAAVLDPLDDVPLASADHPRIPAAVLVALAPRLVTPTAAMATPGAPMPATRARAIPGAPTAPARAHDDALSMKVVLTVRRPGLRRHAGEVAFPGGRWDPADGSLYETALREAEEEIGLRRARLTPLGALSATGTFATNYAVHPFVALLEPDAPEPTGAARGGQRPGEALGPSGVSEPAGPWSPSPAEVDAVLEPTLAELAASSDRATLTRRGFTFETDVYRVGERIVWGLTARVVGDLLARVATIGG